MTDDGDRFLVCDAAAAVAVAQRFVDEHLCAACMEQVQRSIDGGLGRLLRETAAVAAGDFLPIRDEVACSRCMARACFAWVTVEIQTLCRDHAEENGWLPEASS